MHLYGYNARNVTHFVPRAIFRRQTHKFS